MIMIDLKKLAEKYKMDELEVKALKVCQIWMEMSKKIFPSYNHNKFGKGDPRKTLMFKVCYKLIRETSGFIGDDDYPLYVRAQLDILKHISLDKGHPLIEVNCLVGDKAWKRWKLWKKKYDTTVQIRSKSATTKVNNPKIIEALRKTKEFFSLQFENKPTYEKFKELEKDGSLYRYVNFGKISPYYLVLSPYFEKLSKECVMQKMNFDIQLYKTGIDESTLEHFKNLFIYEF